MLGRNVATGLQQDLNCRLRTGLAPRPIRPTNAYSQGSNEARPACPAHATADSRGLGKPCRIPFREKRNDRGPRAANSPMNFSRRSPLTAGTKKKLFALGDAALSYRRYLTSNTAVRSKSKSNTAHDLRSSSRLFYLKRDSWRVLFDLKFFTADKTSLPGMETLLKEIVDFRAVRRSDGQLCGTV